MIAKLTGPLGGYISLAVAIGCQVFAQLALKKAAVAQLGLLTWPPNPYLIIGLAFYVAATPFYLVSLKYLPVSVAAPFLAIGYAFTAYAAHLVFGETFRAPQVIGLLLVGLGLYAITRPA